MNLHDDDQRTALLTVDRGMQVLRAFRCDRASLSNAELVRRTGLSKATVSRLTSTLLELGFIRHVPGGREFELDTGAFAMGDAFVTGSPMTLADPHLQQLADALDVSVALAVGDRLDMLYVNYKAGRRVGTLRMGIGSVLPMGTTAIGHAYLWGLPTVERERLVGALKTQAGAQGSALESRIGDSFTEMEAGGPCGVLGGHRPGTFGIAVPVVVGRDRVVMGLSCGRADVRPDMGEERRRIGPALIESARAIEKALADIAA